MYFKTWLAKYISVCVYFLVTRSCLADCLPFISCSTIMTIFLRIRYTTKVRMVYTSNWFMRHTVVQYKAWRHWSRIFLHYFEVLILISMLHRLFHHPCFFIGDITTIYSATKTFWSLCTLGHVLKYELLCRGGKICWLGEVFNVRSTIQLIQGIGLGWPKGGNPFWSIFERRYKCVSYD